MRTDGTVRVGDGLALGDDLVAAAAEAVAAAMRILDGAKPDLACVFVSGGDPDEQDAALSVAHGLLQTPAVIGCNAHGVIGAGRGVEGTAAVSVWAAVLPGTRVRAFHLEVMRTPETIAVLGMPPRLDDDVVALLLADPWSFPVDGFVGRSSEALTGLPLIGGIASGGENRGETRLLVDGRVHDRGAVGVILSGRVSVRSLVSQGCRPVGPAMTVTSADGRVLRSLAGAPAVQRAREVVAGLPPEEQALAVRGLHLGIAMNEYSVEQDRGDFLVRTLSDVDGESGSVSLGDVVELGSTVRFHLRDADAAHEDLVELLAVNPTEPAAGALVFSGSGRGRAMFPSADHDPTLVRESLGAEGIGGFFAAGEIGPVGGRSHVHGFSTSILVLDAECVTPGCVEIHRRQRPPASINRPDLSAEFRAMTEGRPGTED